MEPKDRDAVFKKAGTRLLPIVYIDDVYVGDQQRLFQLDQSGELDRLLKYNEGKQGGGGFGKSIHTPVKQVQKPPQQQGGVVPGGMCSISLI